MSFNGARDWVMYQGQRFTLVGAPLETRWAAGLKRPLFSSPGLSNARGYVAGWLIEEDLFFLTALDTAIGQKLCNISDVFPDEPVPIPASWFCGTIRVPDIASTRYQHVGYNSSPVNEFHFTIVQGQVVLVEQVDQRAEKTLSSELTSRLDEVFDAQEAAFLRAIHANRLDIAPRLIYADWLQERLDVRAEYVRSSGPLANGHPFDMIDTRPESEAWRRILK